MLTELAADPELVLALSESGERAWRMSAYRGAELLRYDLAHHPSGDLTWDGDGILQATGEAHIVDSGESLVPRGFLDPLAPAGQELLLEYIVRGADQEWVIPCGKMPIADVPDMQEYRRRFPTAYLSLGYHVRLILRDRFDTIRASDFLHPEAPLSTTSTWDEIRRLSPFPIVPTLADQPIPASLVYGDSRMDAITQLARNLGGVPHLTREGYLSVLTISGVIEMSDSMSNRLYNAVRVRTTVGENTILAIAQITDEAHPLYVGGPFGVRTYGFSSPLITDQAAADATAATVLARVSSQHAKTVKVRTLPNPLIELGDFIAATDLSTERTVTGEVVGIRMSFDATAAMVLTMRVAEVTS
jgi:hypothetical protein